VYPAVIFPLFCSVDAMNCWEFFSSNLVAVIQTTTKSQCLLVE
jgi:hypothetical protein